VLHALRTLRIPVIVTLRSELWNARIAELSVALSDSKRATIGRAIRVLELGVWTAAEIVAFVDAVDYSLSPGPRENLRAFRDLVLNGEYELYYGDIPCRPLFLRMVVDDVMVSGIRRRGRVDLFDEWITRKLIRDHQAPLDIGGEGRVSLLDRRTGLDEELRLARTVMVTAARAMVAPADDGTLVLTPYVTDDELRERVPAHLNQFDLTGLVVGSLLVTTRTERPGRPLQLHFAHRAFLEFFFAESLLRTPDTETERLVPDSVRQWIDEMRRSGY
jgi:hypothetical protein